MFGPNIVNTAQQTNECGNETRCLARPRVPLWNQVTKVQLAFTVDCVETRQGQFYHKEKQLEKLQTFAPLLKGTLEKS